MIAAVLDTNVLASGIVGIVRLESTPGELLRRWRANAFTLVLSEPILAELIRTLTNPYFAARLAPSEVTDTLRRLHGEAHLQPITERVSGHATHREDDVILATALSAKADFLVTGDRGLHAIRVFQGVRVVSPREFLAILDAEGSTRG